MSFRSRSVLPLLGGIFAIAATRTAAQGVRTVTPDQWAAMVGGPTRITIHAPHGVFRDVYRAFVQQCGRDDYLDPARAWRSGPLLDLPAELNAAPFWSALASLSDATYAPIVCTTGTPTPSALSATATPESDSAGVWLAADVLKQPRSAENALFPLVPLTVRRLPAVADGVAPTHQPARECVEINLRVLLEPKARPFLATGSVIFTEGEDDRGNRLPLPPGGVKAPLGFSSWLATSSPVVPVDRTARGIRRLRGYVMLPLATRWITWHTNLPAVGEKATHVLSHPAIGGMALTAAANQPDDETGAIQLTVAPLEGARPLWKPDARYLADVSFTTLKGERVLSRIVPTSVNIADGGARCTEAIRLQTYDGQRVHGPFAMDWRIPTAYALVRVPVELREIPIPSPSRLESGRSGKTATLFDYTSHRKFARSTADLRITLRATSMPAEEVLRRIGEQMGVPAETTAKAGKRIDVAFSDTPVWAAVDDVVRKLSATGASGDLPAWLAAYRAAPARLTAPGRGASVAVVGTRAVPAASYAAPGGRRRVSIRLQVRVAPANRREGEPVFLTVNSATDEQGRQLLPPLAPGNMCPADWFQPTFRLPLRTWTGEAADPVMDCEVELLLYPTSHRITLGGSVRMPIWLSGVRWEGEYTGQPLAQQVVTPAFQANLALESRPFDSGRADAAPYTALCAATLALAAGSQESDAANARLGAFRCWRSDGVSPTSLPLYPYAPTAAPPRRSRVLALLAPDEKLPLHFVWTIPTNTQVSELPFAFADIEAPAPTAGKSVEGDRPHGPRGDSAYRGAQPHDLAGHAVGRGAGGAYAEGELRRAASLRGAGRAGGAGTRQPGCP